MKKNIKENAGPFIQKKNGVVHFHPIRHARTFSQRFIGLMGTQPQQFNYALIFHLAEAGTLNASIHMLFMRMPIDVLWLDQNQQIVDMVENLPPWTLNYTPRAPAKYIIELPAGSIEKGKLMPRQKITWI